MRFWHSLFLTMALAVAVGAARSAAKDDRLEAIVFIVGDQHSAYERTAQLVATIHRIKNEHPGTPAAILIDGDTFEYGNVVA